MSYINGEGGWVWFLQWLPSRPIILPHSSTIPSPSSDWLPLFMSGKDGFWVSSHHNVGRCKLKILEYALNSSVIINNNFYSHSDCFCENPTLGEISLCTAMICLFIGAMLKVSDECDAQLSPRTVRRHFTVPSRKKELIELLLWDQLCCDDEPDTSY